MAICDLDVAPAFERSKHHEEIGGAIALVLIIKTGRASRFHRDRHARFELIINLKTATGRARITTNPARIGSEICTKMTGKFRVARCNSATAGVALDMMTSGARLTSSAA